MKLRTKILIAFVIILLLGIGLLGNIGGRLIIQINKDMYQAYKGTDQRIQGPSDYSLQSETIHYTSNDGLKLTAVVVKSDSLPEKGTVILVHGIRSSKESYLSVSKLLARNGYCSVLVDLRAHGESEGEYCTFGFREKRDMKVLLDSLSNRKDLNSNFGIWGHSLGAAVALQSLSIDKRLKFGVIESTFAEFRTVVHEYSERTIGLNVPVINDYAIWWAEMIGDFDGDEVKPCELVKEISQPILMVHGTLDSNIDIKYGKLNFSNLASEDKEFVEIINANHGSVWKVGGQSYFDKVISFLNRVSLNDTRAKLTVL